MPEAPEVQTVLSTLEAQIKDVSIEDVLIYYPKICLLYTSPSPRDCS